MELAKFPFEEWARETSADFCLIDSHCHIDGAEYDADRDQVVARANACGVRAMVNMGDAMASSARSVAMAAKYPSVFTGVGIHPGEVFPATDDDMAELARWSEEPKVVAIGEIGLDYYWEKDPDRRRLQREIFIRQLSLARELDLPVCIHDREAHGDLMAILRAEGRQNRGVIHCYSGSWDMARELLKMGWYLGVDGPVTYKNTVKALETIREIPLDRLLVETDSPYLTALPFRGRRNEPAGVRLVAAKVAELRGVSLSEVAAQTTANVAAAYGISPELSS